MQPQLISCAGLGRVQCNTQHYLMRFMALDLPCAIAYQAMLAPGPEETKLGMQDRNSPMRSSALVIGQCRRYE